MKPDDMIKTAMAAIIGLAFAGAAFGFDSGPAINLIVKLVEWFLPGAVVGILVAGIVTAITRELPKGLLFGGTTALALTVVLRVVFWIQMHTPGH